MQIVVALLAGILGGASIGMIAVDWMVTWLKSVGYVGGFFIWQMGVAFALFGGYFLGSKASGEPTQEPRS